MAAFVTHILIGLLIGLSLRVRLRYVWLVALAGAAVDLDNLFFYLHKPDPWWLTRRATLQNIWFSVVFPAIGAAGAFLWHKVAPDLKRLAAAIPAATLSHTFFDMILPAAPYEWRTGHMLLFPFSDARWTFNIERLMADERLFDGFALLLLVLLPVMATSLLLTTGIGRAEGKAEQWVRVGAFLAVYLVVVPSVLFGFGVTTNP